MERYTFAHGSENTIVRCQFSLTWQILGNPNQNPSRLVTIDKHSKIHVEIQSIFFPQVFLAIPNKIGGLSLPDFKTY